MTSILLTAISLIIAAAMCHAAGIAFASDDEIAAATLIKEAGGEGEIGMRAVMNVIQNRAKRRHLSFREVCLEPKQFSCWNYGYSSWSARQHKLWPLAEDIVRIAKAGKLDDITHGAYFYQRNELPVKKWHGAKTLVFKNHTFYRRK